MLLEFRVTNYRSIKDTQVLSMVANKDKALLDSNCIRSNIKAIPCLVRSAVMYGANASGKSNIISAITSMRNIILTSFTTMEGQKYFISPFRFSPECEQQPIEFETAFIENSIHYQYGFALTSTQIIKEWLLAYPKSKPQRWFERKYNSKKEKYEWYFGPHFIKQKDLIASWKDQTRSNALFLSTAIHLNSEQLRPLFNWFMQKLVIIPNGFHPDLAYTVKYADDNDQEKLKIIHMTQAADLGIVDFYTEVIKEKGINVQLEPGGKVQTTESDLQRPKITFFHQSKDNKKISFDFSEESHGTQRFFAYAGPLLDILTKGHILIVDELDNSFHSHIVRFLINLFHNQQLNSNAQLIFSTHNTSLLDTDLFRRDQIWFLEKDEEQASHLYPLTDFISRKGESLEKDYLLGRYGALPFLEKFNF